MRSSTAGRVILFINGGTFLNAVQSETPFDPPSSGVFSSRNVLAFKDWCDDGTAEADAK